MGDLSGFLRALPIPDRVRRMDLVEKDYHMQRVLHCLSEDSVLSKDIVFKGGTCLTKAHLGYYRFSEDLDFTWRHQEDWFGLPTAQVKKRCSTLIGEVAVEMEVMAADLGFDFLADKNEPDQVAIGSGGCMVTYYLWYPSQITGNEEFLKVQVNFVDEIHEPIEMIDLMTFLEILSPRSGLDRLVSRHPEEVEVYTQAIRFPCYSAREVFMEKCRAILTRKGVKHRDLIDVAMLEEKIGLNVIDNTDDIIKKTVPMLKYKRYVTNLKSRQSILSGPVPLNEQAMLILPLTPEIEQRMHNIYEEIYRISIDIQALLDL